MFQSLGAATLKAKSPVRSSVLGTSREFFIFDLILLADVEADVGTLLIGLLHVDARRGRDH